MKLIDFNWNPNHRQLRQFGWLALFLLPVIGWYWTHSLMPTLGCLVAGIAAAGLGCVAPRILSPLFVGLSLIAFPIGLLISELALLVLYFGVMLPIGLLLRLAGRDGLQLKIDRQAESYWRPKKQPKSPASYYRQS